jgi:hypothetical protein
MGCAGHHHELIVVRPPRLAVAEADAAKERGDLLVAHVLASADAVHGVRREQREDAIERLVIVEAHVVLERAPDEELVLELEGARQGWILG